MSSLPISGLPNITGATDSALIPIVVGGVTYNINIKDLRLVPLSGTTGQVLTKTNSTDTGYTWQNLYETTVPLRRFGVFTDSTTQTGTTNSSQAMKFNTTEHSSGVTINDTTQITMASEGFYNIQFSAQLDKTSNGTDDVSIWFRRNGDDIANSNTVITVTKQAGHNGRNVAAWNYVDYFTAGQYLEIMWSGSDSTIRILAQETLSTPTRPSTPSVIVTVVQI